MKFCENFEVPRISADKRFLIKLFANSPTPYGINDFMRGKFKEKI